MTKPNIRIEFVKPVRGQMRFAYPKDKTTPVHRLIFVNSLCVGIVWENKTGEHRPPSYVCWWSLRHHAAPRDYRYGCGDYSTLERAMDAARKRLRRELEGAHTLLQAGL